jgi:glutamate synthase domain-containing protein 2
MITGQTAKLRSYLPPRFLAKVLDDRCIRCGTSVRQCGWDALRLNELADRIESTEMNCTGCHRCVALCPTKAIWIEERPLDYRRNFNWTPEVIEDVVQQSESGGIILTGMGDDKGQTIYWDKLVLNASQVTNPSIDPLREPMELRTYLGAKPDALDIDFEKMELKTRLSPLRELELPIMFSAISYGALSLQVQEGLARAATEMGTFWNTGEGGLHKKLYPYRDHTIVQVASGRFGVSREYLDNSAMVEIKIGQGAKPGIGGHLPGNKVTADVASTRMIPLGSDALSPAPHHDIYSIEDLRMLIYALKEATNNEKPVSVKISAVHNAPAIASGVARAGADIIAVDGLRGSTGAAPKIIRDNVGIPIELALAAIDTRLRQEGIRNQVSLICAGGIRNSGDVVKAIALGADAAYIATSALIAVGCHVCQGCPSGRCSWGITTTDPHLAKRQNPDIAARRLANLLKGWEHEIKEMLGGMGVNSLESLRGNRDHLRGVGLSDTELGVLGVRHAGM